MRSKITNKISEAVELANERRWVFIIAAIAAILSSIPYIWALLIAPAGTHFMGFTHNIDDGAVYISWIQQIVDGSLTYRNLYTLAAGQGKQFNILVLAMGLVAKLGMLPAVWVFHGFRLGLTVLLVWTVWIFSQNFIGNRAERKLFIILVCFSSGIGWLLGQVVAGKGSVDMWQPEAITFLSMYLNPLFLAGLVLMVAAFHFLLLADKTGQIKYAVYSGLCLLALANVHTYDLITVGAVWTVWFIFSCIVNRTINTRTLLLSLIAVAISIPAVGYQYYLYSTDPIYNARANTVIASPVMLSYICGFGIVFAGAILGAYVAYKRHPISMNVPAQYLPIVWAVMGFVVAYIPVAQQRKLIMGVHIPLCILCAMGLSWLVGKMPRKFQLETLIILMVVIVQSNVSFLKNDVILLSELKTVTHYPAYLNESQIQAAQYLKSNSNKNEVVFASPTMSLFVPAISGRRVFYGHWSETPDYSNGVMKWKQFTDKQIVPEARRAIWLSTKADYYISESEETLPPAEMLLDDAKQVYQAGDVRVFKLNSSKE